MAKLAGCRDIQTDKCFTHGNGNDQSSWEEFSYSLWEIKNIHLFYVFLLPLGELKYTSFLRFLFSISPVV